MDERIVKGLEALGLSKERVAEFAGIVDEVKDRVRGEGMIIRRRAPLVTQKVATAPKARKRTVTVSYRPSSGRIVEDEILMLQARLARGTLPPWQKEQYEARLDSLQRTGKTMASLARDTLAHIPGAMR